MKKLILMLLTLVCAFCCAFGFAACSEGGEDDTTVAVTSVTLNATELTLEIGGEETLTATVAPDDATNKTVTWSVAPTGIVTVENGKVTAVAAGEATVTATAGGKTAACTVTVNVAAPDNSLAGKTFIFSKVECETWDADRIEMFNTLNAGSTIAFETEAIGTITSAQSSMVQKFTYTQADNKITLTITEMTMDGVPQDVSELPQITMTLEDNKLVTIQQAGPEDFMYQEYVLQTAE